MSNTPIVLDIARYVSDNTSLTLNTNLFVGEIPQGVEGVYIIQNAGSQLDIYTPIEYYILSFWTKYKKSIDAFNVSIEVQELLHQAQNIDLNNYRLFFAHALGGVQDMDRDLESNKILKLDINVIVGKLA